MRCEPGPPSHGIVGGGKEEEGDNRVRADGVLRGAVQKVRSKRGASQSPLPQFPPFHGEEDLPQRAHAVFHTSLLQGKYRGLPLFRIEVERFAEKNRVMYQDFSRTWTAMTFKAAMLSDQRHVPSERTCLPQQAEVEVVEEEEEGPEALGVEAAEASAEVHAVFGAHAENGEMTLGVKELRGWPISYRQSQPEKRTFAEWRKRFSSHRKKWQKWGIALGVGVARPSVAQMIAKKKAEVERKRRISRG